MNREEITTLVDRAIALDAELKIKKSELDGIKAEIQAELLKEMENKNLKFTQAFGEKGSCEAFYKQKISIDNYQKLLGIFGDLLLEKTTKKEEVNYDIEKKFKDALICFYLGDYKEHDLIAILQTNLNITDDKKIKMLLKKLKGDYFKDKALLESLGVVGNLEEELDAIREQKNYELITRFFNIDEVNIEELKKAIFVEDTLAIGLTYEK